MSRQEALARLRHLLTDLQTRRNDELKDIVDAREDVLARFRPIFSPEHLPDLSAEEFRSFLAFKNNKHWKGIHRQGRLITEDMPALREALLLLVDESQPIVERLRLLRPPSGEPKIKFLGRSILTPILLVSFPEKYGVWNQVVEDALKTLNLWPSFKGSDDFAARYDQVNKLLGTLASELGIDRWTLDSLWWGVIVQETPPDDDGESPPPVDEEEEIARFGLERHLHEFLFDNWPHTNLGQEWDLFEKDGEIVGFKYNTREVGEIDLLAKHKKQPRWLIIELKLGRTSDQTVGQLLRYRGWVRHHLVENNEEVEGLIICREADKKLLYALEGVPDVSVLTYEVSFALHAPPQITS